MANKVKAVFVQLINATFLVIDNSQYEGKARDIVEQAYERAHQRELDTPLLVITMTDHDEGLAAMLVLALERFAEAVMVTTLTGGTAYMQGHTLTEHVNEMDDTGVVIVMASRMLAQALKDTTTSEAFNEETRKIASNYFGKSENHVWLFANIYRLAVKMYEEQLQAEEQET